MCIRDRGKLKIGDPGAVTLEFRPIEGAWNPINIRSVVLRPAK